MMRYLGAAVGFVVLPFAFISAPAGAQSAAVAACAQMGLTGQELTRCQQTQGTNPSNLSLLQNGSTGTRKPAGLPMNGPQVTTPFNEPVPGTLNATTSLGLDNIPGTGYAAPTLQGSAMPNGTHYTAPTLGGPSTSGGTGYRAPTLGGVK